MKRREKEGPWGFEIDLGGKFAKQNMLKSRLGVTKEANSVFLEEFKKQEDVKLYSQLPDYDDFQCYVLGADDILLQVALRIYANFHKPS